MVRMAQDLSPDDRVPASGTVSVDVYRVIEEAVDAGVAYGWNRAHKHDERPTPETIQDAISRAVMGELCEWLRFP